MTNEADFHVACSDVRLFLLEAMQEAFVRKQRELHMTCELGRRDDTGGEPWEMRLVALGTVSADIMSSTFPNLLQELSSVTDRSVSELLANAATTRIPN